jgi:hypothetical protein
MKKTRWRSTIVTRADEQKIMRGKDDDQLKRISSA